MDDVSNLAPGQLVEFGRFIPRRRSSALTDPLIGKVVVVIPNGEDPAKFSMLFKDQIWSGHVPTQPSRYWRVVVASRTERLFCVTVNATIISVRVLADGPQLCKTAPRSKTFAK